MSPKRPAGRLDKILDLPPSEEAWERVRAFFLDWPAGPSLYSAVQRADHMLREWPDELRVTGHDPIDGVPDPWWQHILQEAKLPGYAPLARAWSISPRGAAPPEVQRLKPFYQHISTVVSPRPLAASTMDRLRETLPSLQHVVVRARAL